MYEAILHILVARIGNKSVSSAVFMKDGLPSIVRYLVMLSDPLLALNIPLDTPGERCISCSTALTTFLFGRKCHQFTHFGRHESDFPAFHEQLEMLFFAATSLTCIRHFAHSDVVFSAAKRPHHRVLSEWLRLCSGGGLPPCGTSCFCHGERSGSNGRTQGSWDRMSAARCVQ